jgi:hypothetical protein
LQEGRSPILRSLSLSFYGSYYAIHYHAPILLAIRLSTSTKEIDDVDNFMLIARQPISESVETNEKGRASASGRTR